MLYVSKVDLYFPEKEEFSLCYTPAETPQSQTSPLVLANFPGDLFWKKLLYVHVDTVEDIFATIDNIIATVRKSNKDKLVTIVTDSVSAASTKIEMAADYAKDGYATTKAILISKAMRSTEKLKKLIETA